MTGESREAAILPDFFREGGKTPTEAQRRYHEAAQAAREVAGQLREIKRRADGDAGAEGEVLAGLTRNLEQDLAQARCREDAAALEALREYLGRCDRELVEAFRAWAAAHNEALRLLAVLRETWRWRKGVASRAQATLRRAVEAGPERKRQDAALDRLPGGSDLGGLLRLVCGAAPTGRKVQVLSQRVEPRLFLGGEESHKEAA